MRTIAFVQSVLDEAKLKGDDLDDIILVGGQSRMPMISRLLKVLDCRLRDPVIAEHEGGVDEPAPQTPRGLRHPLEPRDGRHAPHVDQRDDRNEPQRDAPHRGPLEPTARLPHLASS